MVPDPHSRRLRLFLSFGHRDAMELALRLRNEFEAAGYSVWQDEKRIRAGRAWTDEIRQGLRESDLVIALLRVCSQTHVQRTMAAMVSIAR
jgi:TIR domain